MPKGRRKRRFLQYTEQLAFVLKVPEVPVTDVETMAVGHFVGVRMSNGLWKLTVAPPKPSYLVEKRTPQLWWATVAAEDYTLHGWCDAGQYIISDRDDVESPAMPIDLRATATRWLRSFNEAYQNWRMEELV